MVGRPRTLVALSPDLLSMPEPGLALDPKRLQSPQADWACPSVRNAHGDTLIACEIQFMVLTDKGMSDFTVPYGG